MEVHARSIIGTTKELDTLATTMKDATVLTLAEHDAAGSPDWARASRRDSLTLSALYAEIAAIVNGAGFEGVDYVSAVFRYATPETPVAPALSGSTTFGDVPYRWIAVYPVTGTSEGHYIHVDLIWQRDGSEGRIALFLVKTFGGHAEAVAIAGLLARVLGV